MAAAMMLSVPAYDMHSSVGLVADHKAAAMMATEPANDMLSAVCRRSAARGAEQH